MALVTSLYTLMLCVAIARRRSRLGTGRSTVRTGCGKEIAPTQTVTHTHIPARRGLFTILLRRPLAC
uniref:Putative secreted protein n=1 Tax=Anopheles marajoara TaxID=58244 RepID=A0A2M4CGM7_9DIPT